MNWDVDLFTDFKRELPHSLEPGLLRELPPLGLGDPFLREDVGETQRAPPPAAAAADGGDEVDMADRAAGDLRGGGGAEDSNGGRGDRGEK